MRRSHAYLRAGWAHFWRQLRKVSRNPIFLVLTLVGNSILFACASLFYLLEKGINPNVHGYGDALWFAFVTIATVGYGDIVPWTVSGRFVAVFLMLTGGVLFFSFIALLSSAFIEVEFLELEHEVERLRRKVETALDDKSESTKN